MKVLMFFFLCYSILSLTLVHSLVRPQDIAFDTLCLITLKEHVCIV